MKSLLQKFIPLLFSLILIFTLSCGSSSGGGSECNVDASVDISGTWTITESITTSSEACSSENGTQRSYTVTVVQNGNDITLTVGSGGGDLAGTVFSGSLCDDISDWNGSFPEDGGTTTIESADVTATETSFSGSTNWSWTDGTNSCTGTTTLTGNKN